METPPRLRRDPAVAAETIARFAFGPLPPGLAPYLGGALRRVMIGCLPGPAIVAASVEGAPHEFATLPGISPGIPRLLNKLGRVRLAGERDRTGQARLIVHGPATARAGDLTLPDGLAAADPEEVLAEVSAGATLELTATVVSGTGFATRTPRPNLRGFAVAGVHSPVARVRIDEVADDLLLEIETPGTTPLASLRDAAALLRAHLRLILPGGDPDTEGASEVSGPVRRKWGRDLGRITYSYDAADKRIAVRDIRPTMAGPAGELLAAAVARRSDPPAVAAEVHVVDGPGLPPRLEVACMAEAPGSECLAALREAGSALCQLLAGFAADPLPEPVALPAAPDARRPACEGRIALAEPDLGCWPDDLLAIPKESFEALTGSGPSSLVHLLREFFPIESQDGRWRLDLLQVRMPAPALLPDEARRESAPYEAPILLRVSLCDADGQLIQEQEVPVGALPLMTENATFVLAGKSHDVTITNELRPAPGLTAYRVSEGALAHLAPVHGPELLLRATTDGQAPTVTLDGEECLDIGSVLIAFGASVEEAQSAPPALREWIAAAAIASPAGARQALARLTSGSGLEEAEAAFQGLFRDKRAYDLGEVGRRMLKECLGSKTESGPFLTWRDIGGAALLVQAVAEGRAEGDEPVSLATHVLWPAGRLLSEAVRQGLVAQVPAIAARLSAAGPDTPDIGELLEDLALGDTIARFFASSPLVQPVDDTNRLSRVEHCRRVRLGLARTSGRLDVPLECRQLASDAPGRLCVLQTPEGPNIGLITYLAAGVRLDEHGFLLAPLRPVESGKVAEKTVWLRADEEADAGIAGPHAPGSAIDGPSVACRRDGRLEHCSPEQVDHVEAGDGSLLSASAALIPCLPHSDPPRLLMGANMARQAVQVHEPEPPLVRTGAEEHVLGDTAAHALGRNFLVAYLPWFGHNFEDAIVVSEAVVAGGVLSSVHADSFSVSLRPDEVATPQPAGFPPERLRALGPDGIARVGVRIRPGDVLVGVEAATDGDDLPRALLDEVTEGGSRSLVAPVYASGAVAAVFDRRAPGGLGGTIAVELVAERPLSRGDKLSNRHGAKGVIGKVVPVEEMPVLPDGTPVEVVLNPLGVPSRLNLGQLLEASLGWAAAALRSEIIVPPGAAVSREQMAEMMRRAGLPADGKVVLRDGRTGRCFDQPSLVGYLYLHKLDHLAADKIHARATGPYSPVTQQPTGGRAGFGGQRFGEMETWALEGYGAAETLREVLTIKSDDVRGRQMAYEAILRGEEPQASGAPELLPVLLAELQALGLRAEVEAD